MIPIRAAITGDGYVGIPSFRISFYLQNLEKVSHIVTRLYYELFVEPVGDFLGSGEAFKAGQGDIEIDVLHLAPNCEEVGVASIFELDDRKIGLIERSRDGKEALFKINVYGDARASALDKEGHRETNYKRLSTKVEVKVPKEEWEKWLDSWMAGQRVLLVKKETLDKLDEALKRHNKADYDQLIQELELVEPTEEPGINEAMEEASTERLTTTNEIPEVEVAKEEQNPD